MKAIAHRGDAFLVQHEGTYYLVDLVQDRAWTADPPGEPDCFVKAGEFYEVTDPGRETQRALEEILAAHLLP